MNDPILGEEDETDEVVLGSIPASKPESKFDQPMNSNWPVL